VAFLYNLLGIFQEHKLKPKKFAQTDIDEAMRINAGNHIAPRTIEIAALWTAWFKGATR
jgi:hypothetical protein